MARNQQDINGEKQEAGNGSNQDNRPVTNQQQA